MPSRNGRPLRWRAAVFGISAADLLERLLGRESNFREARTQLPHLADTVEKRGPVVGAMVGLACGHCCRIEEEVQMRSELLVAVVVVALDGCVLEGSVHALDLTIGPRICGIKHLAFSLRV